MLSILTHGYIMKIGNLLPLSLFLLHSISLYLIDNSLWELTHKTPKPLGGGKGKRSFGQKSSTRTNKNVHA